MILRGTACVVAGGRSNNNKMRSLEYEFIVLTKFTDSCRDLKRGRLIKCLPESWLCRNVLTGYFVLQVTAMLFSSSSSFFFHLLVNLIKSITTSILKHLISSNQHSIFFTLIQRKVANSHILRPLTSEILHISASNLNHLINRLSK